MNIFIKIRSTLVLLLLVIIVGQGEHVFAAQSSKQVNVYFVPMQFMFDDIQLTPPSDQQGFIYKNSTYVPMRFISYSLNKAVKWDPATYTVSVSPPSEEDQSTIDTYKRDREVAKAQAKPIDRSKIVSSGIKVYDQKVNYIFDGEAKQLKEGISGLIYKDRLYVPMRFFSEAVGQKIDWDPKTYTVKAQTVSIDVAKPVDLKLEATPVPSPTPNLNSGTSGELGGAPMGSEQIGGGGVVVKPTYEELKSAVEVKILALKNKAFNQLLGLLGQYGTADAATKISLKAQGNALVAGYDGEFAQIISSLQAELTSNGYDTGIIVTYQQEYANQKQLAQGFLK